MSARNTVRREVIRERTRHVELERIGSEERVDDGLEGRKEARPPFRPRTSRS
jgi:hypothetical protein